MTSRELEFAGDVARGAKGPQARRVQEWLELQGYGLSIDGDFGRVTEDAVQRFQRAHRLPATGRVDQRTFDKLIAPLRRALRKPAGTVRSLPAAVLSCAKAHLAQHPREVGGPNRGPWVRLYMDGLEGQPWCAGFVSFVLAQAAAALKKPMPIAGSVSCDTLAAQAKAKNRFVSENPRPGSIFLVREAAADWTHTGFVTAVRTNGFFTIEGNTNDSGEREGYEVCARSRGYKDKDFVLL